MIINRKLSLLILFLCGVSIAAFAIKPKLHTVPIIIDDVVAAGGINGVICEYDMTQKNSGRAIVDVPISFQKRYVVNCYINGNKTATFKMSMVNNIALGIDPSSLSGFTFVNSDLVRLQHKLLDQTQIFEIRPSGDGVSITDVTNDKKVRIFEVVALENICKINPRFDPNFSISPNPVEESFNLSFYLPMDTKMDVFIVDMNNVIQLQYKDIAVEGNFNEINLDATKLLQGIYILKANIKNKNGTIAIPLNSKFVKS